MARTQVQSELLAVNSISGTIIADNAITATHIATNAISGTLVQDGGIVTTMIAANNVTSTKIVTDAIQTRHIADDQVTAAKLANSINTDIATGPAALPKAGGTMTGNIVMGDDTSIGIADDAERIEFDGAGDINILGANLGIGTTSPSHMLHVNAADGASANTQAMTIENNEATDGQSYGLKIKAGSTVNDASLFVQDHDASNDHFIIRGNGAVGIGTTAPSNILHTSGTGVQRIQVDATDNNAAGAGLYMKVLNSGSLVGNATVRVDNTGNLDIFTGTSSESQKMTILAGGNVGIGDTNPGAKLDVNSGTTNTMAHFHSTDDNGFIELKDDNTTGYIGVQDDYVYIGGAPSRSTQNLVINDGDGKVGIGTTSPSGPLEIVDSTSGYDQIKIGHKNGTNENKQGGITTTNYEGNSVSYFQSFNQSGNNGLYIGSADGAHRGFQSIYFYVAENSNTTSGYTKAMQINGNSTVTTGFVGIGSGAAGTNQLQVRSGAANYAAAVFESFTGSGATNYGPYVNLINGPNDGTRYLQRWDSGGSTRAQITSSGHFQSSVNSYGSTSDIKLKENIVDATPKLDDVMKLKVKNFNYIADEDNEKLIGMIAQDVEEVFPGLVFESEDTKTVEGEIKHVGTTTKSLKYSVFVPVLIKAVQELKAELEAAKARITTLEG